MTRPNRIKEVTLEAFSVVGSNFSSYIETNPNGELLRVVVENITSPGSIILAESGTGIELWRKNSFTSGLAAQEAYPGVFMVDSIGGTGSPNNMCPRINNTSLYVAGSGMTSGTGTTFGPIRVLYR